jgi:hypothetical protein
MRVLKSVLIGVLIIFLVNSLSVLSYGQGNVGLDQEKLADLVDSPRTKQLLAKQFDGIPNISFDMDTMAFDFFRDDVVVVTLDFEYVPLAKHGTASIAYRWVDMDFILLYSSYWWWGTLVSDSIYTDTTWTPAGSPYYVTDWTWIDAGVTLTIEPGTVVRFRKSNNWTPDLEVEGTLNCSGAVFTTSCDFENYDNSQVEWNDSDWEAIYVYEGGTCLIEDSLIEYGMAAVSCWGDAVITISGCTIRRCNVGLSLGTATGEFTAENNLFEDCEEGIGCRYFTSSSVISGNTITMGTKWWGWAGIYCYQSSPVISSNMISGYSHGTYCRNSSPEISLNTFQNNGDGVLALNESSPVIHNNNIEGNSNYGVRNGDDAVLIDAENNWWGDPSGPYHPIDNPSGLGNEVSDYVDCDPWLTSVVTALLAL